MMTKECRNCDNWLLRFTEKNPLTKEDERFGSCAKFIQFHLVEPQIFNGKDYCYDWKERK